MGMSSGHSVSASDESDGVIGFLDDDMEALLDAPLPKQHKPAQPLKTKSANSRKEDRKGAEIQTSDQISWILSTLVSEGHSMNNDAVLRWTFWLYYMTFTHIPIPIASKC